jgi:tellurite resistance protein TehA-like permease
MKTKLKLFILILLITTISMWVLGVLRFNSDIIKIIHNIIFFPFGFLAVVSEDYILVNYLNNRFLNDEIFNAIIWLLSVLLQAILYYLIIIKVWKKRSIA